MFTSIRIWDVTLFTKGTVVKLNGFSAMNNFRFKGLEYRVKKVYYETLTVQSKNGHTYEIMPWEIGDDPDTDLSIEITEQIPYVIPF